MVGISNKEAPLRLLSLDGGGVTAISELFILKETMLQIQRQSNLCDIPKPCDFFDMIGGSGTGGLFAIMLGRLHMPIDDALEEYRHLAVTVFSEKKFVTGDGVYKASTFEKVSQGIVQKYGADHNKTLLDQQNESPCKVFVCCRSTMAMNRAKLLRSYPSYTVDDAPNATIWEAARATTATPGIFKRLRVKTLAGYDELIDGSLGSKNPARILLNEAAAVFGPERAVSCIMSIGSGPQQITDLASQGFLQRLIPTQLVSAVKNMAYDAEQTARELEYKFGGVSDLYFRFNTKVGLDNIESDEWKKMGEIKSLTLDYLNSPNVAKDVVQAASVLYNDAEGKFPISRLV